MVWQHAAHTADQFTSSSAKQEPCKEAYLFTKNIEEFSGKKKSQENGPASRRKKRRENRRKKRVTGLCRRKRMEIIKWNQMTALRFQTELNCNKQTLKTGMKSTWNKKSEYWNSLPRVLTQNSMGHGPHSPAHIPHHPPFQCVQG